MFNNIPDFYPTPKHLIDRMLLKIDWKTVHTILEPSAGKGDLVEGIITKFKNSRSNHYNKDVKWDVDTIEINENLSVILKSKGYRVIADDFLNFFTYKRYDAIIANFPFSIGDKMLIHAIKMQERGGSVVALINADTIRNPYSNTRKELIRLLEKYDADVEFIDNAFVKSERSTGVSVALVTITVPKIEYNSVIIDDLKKEELHTTKQYNNTQLIDSDFIRGIVSQYEYEVKAGLRLIDEYNSLVPLILREFNKDTPVLKLELEYKDDSSTLENAYIKQIRSKYWKALFNNDQFIGLFTSNLKTKYMGMINELQDYDFSFYNIYTLRIQLSKEMVQGVEDTILNLFEELSNKYHYYDEMSRNILHFNGWKTNKSYKINSRVIIPLNAYDNWSGKFDPTQWKIKDKLSDIEKVMNYLDDGNTPEIDLKEALEFAEHYGETKKIELRFFRIDFFKKGTCHITFKNLDLLHNFNLFGSQRKGFLPPSYGKAKYTEMSKEEKQVIDEFEGKESYNKVMANQSYYLVKTEELLRLTS